MMSLLSPQEAVSADAISEKSFCLPPFLLMENAALASLNALKKETALFNKRIVIVCGSGNNGGDGLALARHIHCNGGIPQIVLADTQKPFSETTKAHYKIVKSFPIPVDAYPGGERFKSILENSDWIVDALLGTGLSRKISGNYATIISLINASEKPVLSLDIPSGVNGLTGEANEAVQASATITFCAPKRGNLLYPGCEKGGRLYLSRISIPQKAVAETGVRVEINHPPPLAEIPSVAHKGSQGDVLTIGGSEEYFGAPLFAAAAALRSGAGYSRLLAPEGIVRNATLHSPELIVIALGGDQRAITPPMSTRIKAIATKSDAVILGPGLSCIPDTIKSASILASGIDKPLIVDGDALTAISGRSTLIERRKEPTILTPHPGEAARLLGITISEVEEDRIKSTTTIAQRYNAVTILKGFRTLIGSPDGKIFMNLSGNPGLATAGTGDILSGIVGAFAAKGYSDMEAARLGAFLHGYAADVAVQETGIDGLTAGGVLEFLPRAIKNYRLNREKILNNSYGKIIEL